MPKTFTRQRRDCDLNLGPSAPESSTLTTRLPSHPYSTVRAQNNNYKLAGMHTHARIKARDLDLRIQLKITETAMLVVAVDAKSLRTETFVAAVHVEARVTAAAIVHQTLVDVCRKLTR